MRGPFPATLAVALAFGGCAAATTPVVAELFTSEGCSSCPPADEHLFELRRRDGVPVPGWHVDYRDWPGRRDRFADPEFSARQRAYARRLGTPVYTPQLVVSGTHQAIGSAKQAIDAVIRRARSTIRQDVVITTSWREANLLEIALGERSVGDSHLVHVVGLAAEARTEVTAGENATPTSSRPGMARPPS